MKSGISCFNRAIFRKNVLLYWPIWVFYTLYLLAVYPGRMWIYFYNGRNHGLAEYLASDRLESLADIINIRGTVISIAIMAVITGMALYNYLCVAKSAHMIHAFPVTRGELYGTNLISGLSFLMVPQLLSFLLSMLVCLGFGVLKVEYLGLFLAVEFGIDFLMFSMVTLCAMLSGQMFAIPVFFLVGNFLYLAIRYLASVVVPYLAYGLRFYTEGNFDWMSPVYFLCEHVWYSREYEAEKDRYLLKSLSLENGQAILWYLLLAVVLYVISYIFYRKRQLEDTGDLITVGIMRPVFRWGTAFMIAYLSGIALNLILDAESIEVSVGGLVASGFLIGILFFFLAQMLLEKNFRVFRKKRLLESLCCGIFLLMTFGVMCGIAYYSERYIPQEDEIQYAVIDMDFPVVINKDEIQDVLDIHQSILSNREENRELNEWNSDAVGIQITYQLYNRKTVKRYYLIQRTEETAEMIASIYQRETEPEVFLENLLGSSDEGRMELMYLSNWNVEDEWREDYIEIYNSWSDMEEGEDTDAYDNAGEEAAYAVYQAIVADAKAGVLQKYNINELAVASKAYKTMYSAELTIEMRYNAQGSSNAIKQKWEYQYDEEMLEDLGEYNYYGVYFGTDCVNILNALKEYGFIGSEDELHIYTDPEDVVFY